MTRGGFRVGAGRRPDRNALDTSRRRSDFIVLPAEGPQVDPPAWPLPRNKQRETMWARLWQRPQASEWERLGLEDQVAAYVVAYTESVTPGAPAALKTATLRMQDTLGLSPTGMAALRWRFADDNETPTADAVQGVTDARSRFQTAATH